MVCVPFVATLSGQGPGFLELCPGFLRCESDLHTR